MGEDDFPSDEDIAAALDESETGFLALAQGQIVFRTTTFARHIEKLGPTTPDEVEWMLSSVPQSQCRRINDTDFVMTRLRDAKFPPGIDLDPADMESWEEE